ncbi:ribonuclease J [Candidatus Peregrinibacteria bacterium]|nr:ribonuclease J [Candidatus Peregrinibacteria bacterium]
MDQNKSWNPHQGSSNGGGKPLQNTGNTPHVQNVHTSPQNNSSRSQPFEHHRPPQHERKPFWKQNPKNQNSHQQQQQNIHHQPTQKHRLRVIPLGGLNEVGRNCLCFEYGNDIILVDAGIQFPGESNLGVRCILPDTRYVEAKKDHIRAIIITHGHLDHIGGLRYLLPKLGFPQVFAPPLAAALIEKQLEEDNILTKSKIHKVDPSKDILRLGAFTVEYYRINHSIPDSHGLYIETPAAKVVHTGDFKFDFTPADGKQAEYGKLAKIGDRGVDAIFADSTNAQKDGYCLSEKYVAESLEHVIQNTKQGRLFITSFASVIARWQQIIRLAQKYNRKVYVVGRSLLDNIRIAVDLGFVKVPQNLIHKVTKRMLETPPHQQIILTTGSQGEIAAGLARIIRGEHNIIKIDKNDTVVFSASPIPGNERSTIDVINELYKLGANVITRKDFDVHTSGHGHQGDLKLIYSLLKPKNFVPVHGEFHMRADHVKMIRTDLNIPEENTALIGNGDVLEVFDGKIQKTREKVSGEEIYVDGNMVGDVGTEVQEERKGLMNGGVISFTFHADSVRKGLRTNPEVESLGFAYPHESKHLHAMLKKIAIHVGTEILLKHGDPRVKGDLIRRDLLERLSAEVLKLSEREPKIIISLMVD